MKACPFCGKSVAVVADHYEMFDKAEEREAGIAAGEAVFYAVVCDYTKGGCGTCTGMEKTPGEAIDSWERRAK